MYRKLISLVNEICAIAVMFITVYILLGGHLEYKIFEVKGLGPHCPLTPLFHAAFRGKLRSRGKNFKIWAPLGQYGQIDQVRSFNVLKLKIIKIMGIECKTITIQAHTNFRLFSSEATLKLKISLPLSGLEGTTIFSAQTNTEI